MMSLMACDSNPSRIATGEEVEAAVRNAEAQMVEARAERERRWSGGGHSEVGPEVEPHRAE